MLKCVFFPFVFIIRVMNHDHRGRCVQNLSLMAWRTFLANSFVRPSGHLRPKELPQMYEILFIKRLANSCKLPVYQNSEGRSYEVALKAGSRGYGRSGVTGSAGAYNVGARTRPQLIGCALASGTGCP